MGANPLTTTTKISDVIVPEIFNKYVIEKTAEKSKLIQSGISVANPRLNELVTQGGLTMQMPFWQDLSGDDEVLSDSQSLTPAKIGASKDVAALLMRGKAWGANDLAGALAGDDPMAAIGDRVADYWARKEQATLLSVLKGVFASSGMSGHVLNRSSVATGINASMVLDGKQLLGDSADKLTAILMHSATFTALQKQNLIAYVSTTGASGSQIQIPTYLGYRVVTDDGMPMSTTVSTAGVYTLTISTKGIAGDKITIGDDTLTFVANSATPGAKEIKVGATPNAGEQATNIATWLNANSALKDKFTIEASSNTVLFTNKILTARSVSPVVSVTKTTDGTIAASIANSTTEVAADVYTTYLAARGVIGRGEGTPVDFVNTETDRDSLAGEDILVTRRAFVLHPFGIKWKGTPEGVTPTNAELATGDNWEKVYEDKNIGIVAIQHQVA